MLLKVTHRATVRLCTLPDSHPLRRIVAKAATSPPKTHRSPIDNLLEKHKVNPRILEKIKPALLSPQSRPRFKTRMAATREESIAKEAEDQADFKIYTDGSGNDGNTGAAAAIYRKGHKEPIGCLQRFIGPMTEHNTYKAEAVRLLLGLWLAHKTPGTRNRKVSLYTDNQSIVQAVTRIKSNSGQYLFEEITKIASYVNCDLTIQWISGHSKVEGNERVDEMAKQAAQRTSSRANELPVML
jgi:ribonuclease HI